MKKIILTLCLALYGLISQTQNDFNLFMSMIEDGYRPYLERYQMFNGRIFENDTTSYVSSFIIRSGVTSSYIKQCISEFSKTKSFIGSDGLIVKDGNSCQYSYYDINPDSNGIIILMTKINDRGYVKYSGRFRNRKDSRDGKYSSLEAIDSMIYSLPYSPHKQRSFDVYKLDVGYYVMEIVDIIKLLPQTMNYRTENDILIMSENGLKPFDEICYGYPPSEIMLVEVSEDIGRILVNRFSDIVRIDGGKIIMSQPSRIPRIYRDIRSNVVVSQTTSKSQEDMIVMVKF